MVVIGHQSADSDTAEAMVRRELTEWFGAEVSDWRHLKTYRILHALPEQSPPMPDQTPLSTPFFIVFSYLILVYLRDDTLILVET